MYRLRYVGKVRRSLPEWVLPTYEEVVTVKNGIAYVKKESTVRALLSRGFVLEPEPAPPAEEEEKKTPSVVKKQPARKKEDLEETVVKMFEEDGKSIQQISRELKVRMKTVKDLIERYYDSRKSK